MKNQIHAVTTRSVILFLSLALLAACGDTEVIPATGNWRGEDLSFSVTENGEIIDFSWEIRKEAGPYLHCPIEIPEKRMSIVDGMAEITMEFEAEPQIWFDLQVVFDTETTAALSYDYNFCPSTSISALDENGEEVIYRGEAAARWESP